MKTIVKCERMLPKPNYQQKKMSLKKKDQTENQNLHCIESMNWVGGVVYCTDAAVWFHKRVLA